ncbi:unnamed protein product [Trichogramma brassicae]|uniref:Uncharacterized protein n=1 Tax=Trichogramma brassicae TaxID=86971 RepID=A0A6H5I1L2_9HYME|nr:unnamed protein product [Trichogramma brassicae]
MDPVKIIDTLGETILILTYAIKPEQKHDLLSYIRAIAAGLTGLQAQQPNNDLVVNLRFKSRESKEQSLIALAPNGSAPRQKKDSKPHQSNFSKLDLQRIYVISPTQQSRAACLDRLATHGPLDYAMFQMNSRTGRFTIFVRYCTLDGAVKLLRDEWFGVKHTLTEDSRPRNRGHLPHRKTCLICKHTITAFREVEHQLVCYRHERKTSQNIREPDDVIIPRPRSAHTIMGLKTHYFCGRAFAKTEWHKHLSTCGSKYFDKVSPPDTSCRTIAEIIEEIRKPETTRRKPNLTVTTQLLARVKTIDEDTLETRHTEIPLNIDLTPVHENHKELWAEIHKKFDTEPEVIIID